VADAPEPSTSIAKREPDAPARDPIVSRTTSSILLISALLMIGTLAWALWDESYGQRPWKGIQQQFVKRYTGYLKSIKKDAGKSEAEVKETAEYQTLDAEAQSAIAKVTPRRKEIDADVERVQAQLDAVTDPFQNQRGKITVTTYQVETAPNDSAKRKYQKRLAAEKEELVTVDLPADSSGKAETKKLKFPELEKLYNDLRDSKAKLLTEKAELLKEPSALAKKREDYVKNHVVSLTPKQIDDLIRRNENFDYSILGHQINVNEFSVVDRCEICHLGVREPVTLKAEYMAPDGPNKKPDELARAFVSHPNKELLQIHNPERFGCSGCHGGNGRATTTVEKAHGQNPFWLHPLHRKENTEAGCQQCHANDRVSQGADTLNLGKDLFYQRGCVGCHRSESFDREADALSGTRQTISQLEEQIAANERQARVDQEDAGKVADDTEAKLLQAHAESLRVTNSQLAARIDQLNVQTRFLMQDQKKVGPNLKDVRLKLKKEWIPVWLEDPQAFRKGTKMPTFWRFKVDEDGAHDLKAVAAYLWQEGFEGTVPVQQQGNATHGKELFESRGCMACHSIGPEDSQVGGTFAANLQRVGEKANFDYIVRWIYNPRERWAPYCPKEKRDLTRADYEKHNLPYLFDTDMHSKCPNDGAELQVQNMTVMPNFRLAESDARDIATYLFSLSGQTSYADASFLDDPNLKEEGRAEIKQYGCAGCHEIRGFEDEQRIGKELTAEGATPIERLDFALLTKDAEYGKDPIFKDRKEEWYNHRGFFEHKLADPAIYDQGKLKDPKDRLRMPKPYLTDEWRNALTTFLLGSVGTEGANVPSALFYNPQDQRRQDIQNGWWVIKKYNCMGCHNVQVGQRSVLMDLPFYMTPDGKDLLPPRLTSEGARVDPEWLLRFLHDPSLSDSKGKPAAAQSTPAAASSPAARPSPNPPTAVASGSPSTSTGATVSSGNVAAATKPQPGANGNGVRTYLQARMPTFNFSPNELQTLVRFFMAVSSQQSPYIKENLEPLTEQERVVARQMFTSGTPCLKCHLTGDPTHDKTAIAPNFLLAGERLKPDWTFRWLLDPSQISPGTAMPTGLFKNEGDRWLLNLPNPPPAVADYHRDHARLLVRYMFLLTPDEQRRLLASTPVQPVAKLAE
jgi:cytochrome c551/c552